MIAASGYLRGVGLTALACTGLLLPAPVARGQYLSPAVLQAAEAARVGSATRAQKALLFQNNDAINQARLGGWLPDSTYQAAQREYSSLNQKFAQHAAESTGADFTVQQASSQTYSPGTDSDYIVTTSSGDPVGQIQEMQTRYNEHVNSYLEDALGSEGYQHTPKDNWHNRLDVDFMADPAHVTDEQFRQIAELNNDAYTRRGSAEFERRSRAGGVEVTSEQFADYANEMQDFIENKQSKIDKIKKNPASLTDPETMADYHRLMAQEQKYASRIEAANQLLREQEGLPTTPKPKGPPVYEIVNDPSGKATIRKRPVGSVAQRGSVRSPTNRATTIAASGLADNSVQRAVTELSESMAEAAARNPSKWPNASAQIADMADRLPPSAKGQLLERVAARREAAALEQILGEAGELDEAAMQAARRRARQMGNDYSREVAHEMQARTRAARPSLATRADNALRNSLGVSDDLANMRGMRGAANRRLASAMGGMERLGHLGTAMEIMGAASTGYDIFSNVSRARDPNMSAAEANELYRQAREDLWRLGGQGLMAGVSYAVPTAGAMLGGYEMGYGAGRYVLENTEAGRALDRAALEGFDAAMRGSESLSDLLTEWLGGQSQRMLDEEQLRDIESSYWAALRAGRIRMRPGVRTTDIADMIRSGNLAGVRDLVEPGPNASQSTTDRLAGQPEAKKPAGPNDDLEWINQTFEPESDTKARDDYHQLVAEGKSPIGPVVNPNREEGVVTNRKPDYRARAEQFARQSSRSAANTSDPNYRGKAEQIHARVVAAEQERERQARIAEAQRLEAIRQEQIRQQQIAEARRREAIRQEQIRRQQIAAQQARQRQIAQQQAWQRQQQLARQQAAWNSYWSAQQAMQRRSTYTPSTSTYGGLLPPASQSTWRLGGNSYNGSEYDYNTSKNPIQW